MLKIVICTKEGWEQEEWQQLIRHVLFDREEFEIKSCAAEKDLLLLTEEEKGFDADVIFLDIQMPELDGIRIARTLRARHISADIIFVTDQEKYVYEGYEVHAYDYLRKPITIQKLDKTMKRYLTERKEERSQRMYLEKQIRNWQSDWQDVLYFISDKRKIRVIREGERAPMEFYMKMSELEEKISGEQFFRCHQSYMVSVQKVLFWERSTLVLTDGSRIPVSRRYRERTRERLADIL